jgi:Domain of unknown function (DUF927)/Toprim domain
MIPDHYVSTRAICEAVEGRDPEVLEALGIAWADGAPHISCPYPDHSDEHPSWRWDKRRAKAYCTCIEGSHSIFDVVMRIDGIEFDRAKVRVAEILGRQELIKVSDGDQHQAMDAASLLRPPPNRRDNNLVCSYLAYRLDLPPEQVPMPSTPAVGWRSLAYYDPPANKSSRPKLVGHYPCVVFGTRSPDGRRHAHRIYVQPDGAGKAELGHSPDGRPRDPKKSACLKEGRSAAGCVVLWGDPTVAQHLILSEGVETGAALALARQAEIEAGEVVVAAALSTSGIRSFQPWPAIRRITIAADRDENGPIGDGAFKAGERAARAFALAHHQRVEIKIALPGQPGEYVDWLDILRRDGVETVCAGLDGAERFAPTAQEIEAARQYADRAGKLAEIEDRYPLPIMESVTLSYRHTPSGKIMVHKHAGKGRGDEDIWLPVATPFGVPARLRYADQQRTYGLRAIVQGMDGNSVPIDFDRAALARMGASEIRAQLFAAGLRVEGEGEVVAVQALKAADPDLEVTVVSRPGWHLLPGLVDPIFVTPGGAVFGTPNNYAVELAGGPRFEDPATSGSMDGWRAAVEGALDAANCPHWTLGVVGGFVGPIVALTGLDTCGVNLSGISSSGKTISQKLAASAWGSPRLGAALLQSMRTTENALENLAQASTGTVLILDEVALADGRAVSRMIYSIASGIGKSRQNAQCALRTRCSWRTFVILSSECGLEAKIRGDGGSWLAGMAVRVADIDVTGINRAVARGTLDAISGIERHFGHAGPAFVRGLVRDGHHRSAEHLRREINRATQLLAKGDIGTRIRAATPFACLLVAGELAKALDVIPRAADVRDAVLWAWNRFLESSEAVALDPVEQAVSNLPTWIAAWWDVTVKSVDTGWEDGRRPNNRETLGWYDPEAVYIPTSRLRQAAGDALTEREIAQALDSRGLLARRHDARRIAIRRVPRVGRIDAYALRRDEFGHITAGAEPELKVHEGGRS